MHLAFSGGITKTTPAQSTVVTPTDIITTAIEHRSINVGRSDNLDFYNYICSIPVTEDPLKRDILLLLTAIKA